MTGILGLYDPSGVDAEIVRRSADASAHRGRPLVASDEAVAFAVLARSAGDDPPFADANGSVTVADVRIDAVLSHPAVGLAPARSEAALLASILDEAGPAGFESIAADFAVARFDPRTRELTLARDALGLRPLYWARRKNLFGFASDPEALVAMGLVTGELDRDALVAWLVEGGNRDDRTPFAGIHRVPPGHAVRSRGDTVSTYRWFRPEHWESDRDLTLAAAAHQTREALVAAVASRCSGRSVALSLSGGRDSSAVAVALAEAGVKATCITYVLKGQGVASEAGIARELARSLGHGHLEVPISPELDEDRMSEFVAMSGFPLQAVGIPIQLAIHDALRTVEAEVLLAGEGGDLLFMAFPIVVFDLLRQGQARTAALAARNFHELWTRPYSVTAKIGARAIAPRWVLELRERARERPPWFVEASRRPVQPVRTDRTYLLDLLETGFVSAAEVPERVFSRAGATLAWPLVDLRMVRLGVTFPPLLRAPVPGPKPVLVEALLKGHDEKLVKAPLGGFVKDLLRNTLGEFPNGRGRGSLAAGLGLVRASGLSQVGDLRWAWEAADLLGLEIWLREKERHGA